MSYWSQTGSHWVFFLIGSCCYCCSAAKLCPTLCNPMNCSTRLPCPSPSPWHPTASEGLRAQWEPAVGQPRPQACPIQLCGVAEGHVPATQGLTKRGPLEKGMADYFSILAFRTPDTVWTGQKKKKKKNLSSDECKCGQLSTAARCEVYTGCLQNWVENILPSRGSLLIYGSVTT